MTRFCVARTYAESYDPPMPAEYCDNDAEIGSDYCIEHLYLDPAVWEPDDRSDLD